MFLAKPIVAVLALALLVQQSQAVYEVSITLPQPQQNVLFLPRDSPSVQVVMPSVNHSWGIRPDGDVALTTNNAVGTIVAGPGGQPDNRIGPGSVEFLTRFNPGGKPQLTAPKDVIENVRFTDLTTLNYMSFTQVYASRNWLSFSTNVEIDLDGNPSTRGDRVTMVYEPCYTLNNCSTFVQPLFVWTTFEALAPGAIWWSTSAIPNTAFTSPSNSFAPLDSLYAAYPHATMISILFDVGQSAGGFPWDNFAAYFDGVTLGIRGEDTVYDFEPDRLVNVYVSSKPSGYGYVEVDSQPVITPMPYQWVPGSVHRITAAETVKGSTFDSFWVFNSWSNGGKQDQHFVVPETTTTLIAYYDEYIDN